MTHQKRIIRLSRLVAGSVASMTMAAMAAVAVLGVVTVNPVPLSAATSCEDLAKISLPNVRITLAKSIAAGAFTPPPAPARGGGAGGGGAAPAAGAAAGGGGRGGPAFTDLAPFCQVQATLAPSSDSDIKMEAWLPAESVWNLKLMGVGNGGLGGGVGVNAGGLANGVRLGYVTVGSNTGHEGDTTYAREHPEKIKDWGWRSGHEMTIVAKALIKAHYSRPLLRSVVAQGGGGTMLSLSSAQRFPEDYDFIAATGMSSHFSRHTMGQLWVWMATHKDEASALPMEKLAVLHQGALDACDSHDGLKDGVIGQPERCKFDPVVIQCKGADGSSCLTAPQVEAVRKIYAGPTNPRTKAEIYSPLYPGSELTWAAMASTPQPFGIAINWFRDFVFKDPNWDYRTRPVNFDSDAAATDKVVDGNNVSPDPTKFFARGGKLLLIEGWSDTTVPPKVAIDYYKNVVAKTGAGPTRQSMRFFMVPGMGHGPGTNGEENFNFTALNILEEWAETGRAPDTLIVDHYKNGMMVGKRLVCQYPMTPTYNGTGNTEDPASFACK
ncbi:MAG: hypothetical protein A3G76_09350 [Acidobacteria bacterium RIFCSPLOWO2_12_FULL_65_11]|nr:MAG: hypothetical protein A3G76_09350 [Acidobacteria bacterium RIFCSPLOWO2_12_FULL_65_11]